MTNSSPTDPIREALELSRDALEAIHSQFVLGELLNLCVCAAFDKTVEAISLLDARAAISSMPTNERGGSNDVASDTGGNQNVVVAAMGAVPALSDLERVAIDVADLIEGFPGYGTATNLDGRLKDQPRWISFYNLVRALQTLSPEHIRRGIDE